MMSGSARRLNHLAAQIGARRYLEIGVREGETFFAVDVPYRVAVDPVFAFDKAARRTPGVVFHEVGSDAFFAGLDLDQRFDLIFLDGLHRFEQTYRDLTNALAHSHDRTVILIDDTIPSSLYSAQRDFDRIMAERQRLGRAGDGTWHGDVYKMVLAINDFHPSLDYVTITGDGNPQTVVWRSNARKRQPLLGSMERIDRLDHFEYQLLQPQLHQLPEKDANQYMTSAFTKLGWFAAADGVSLTPR